MKKRNKAMKKGFTLIELLVVIAILAVLAVVVVLTLNPAGLLQEARDSNRISDMATLKSAISLYLADYPSPSLGTSGTCYVSENATTTMTAQTGATTVTSTTNCYAWLPSTGTTTPTFATTTVGVARATAGTTAWIPVDVSKISAGAPFALWPVDPTNNGSYFYSYAASSSPNVVFKIAMWMESTKYKASGTADIVSTDGGINNFAYEGGTNLSL